jgi:hypothetical protein
MRIRAEVEDKDIDKIRKDNDEGIFEAAEQLKWMTEVTQFSFMLHK